MQKDLHKLFDALVPKDQLVVECVILSLANKDKEIRDLTKGVHELLDRKETG